MQLWHIKELLQLKGLQRLLSKDPESLALAPGTQMEEKSPWDKNDAQWQHPGAPGGWMGSQEPKNHPAGVSWPGEIHLESNTVKLTQCKTTISITRPPGIQ